MAKVDLAILRLSAAEILYLEDVPDSASINEAVDMAKKFGGDDSGKFINGILGKVVRSKDAV
jgi:N utilization substance protein B